MTSRIWGEQTPPTLLAQDLSEMFGTTLHIGEPTNAATESHINLAKVGAFPFMDAAGEFHIRFGLYLPGIRAADGFEFLVRLIQRDDRFEASVPPQDFGLAWTNGHPLDLWTTDVSVRPVPNTRFGQEGIYLYRFQLWWTGPGGSRQLLTRWFTDPFARATDIGRLSAVTLTHSPASLSWTDKTYKTPELDDLVVYELQIEEFNDTFDGIVDRLTYLQRLGAAGTISVPFPKAGTWQEMVDADVRFQTISVGSDGDVQTITVPSNYGAIFVRQD